ncbi:hypothetical protein [Rhodopirellula europaea]|uniref:Membrane protein n=1 Tax=Rhodopirellula europaea SH398 TaxID=1263868 RepID=M5S1K7_9BACT|nr:hypothetical protein [Rhodopirellula europaea]EMI25306.1 membrane protein [Rhodopirellula europaea SH398]
MKSTITLVRLIWGSLAFCGVVALGHSLGNPRPPFHEMVAFPVFLIVLLSNAEELADAFRCYVGSFFGMGVGWVTAFPEHVGRIPLLALIGWLIAACYNYKLRRRQSSTPHTCGEQCGAPE